MVPELEVASFTVLKPEVTCLGLPEVMTLKKHQAVAALLVENGRNGITYLFNRDFPELFGYPALFIGLASYFFFSCWAAGSALAGGLVVPMFLNLELFTAGNVMKRHPRTVHLRESVVCLARLLQDTPHSAFPVIHKPDQDHHEVFVGTITRMELCKLLQSERIFESEDLKSDVYINQLSYEEEPYINQSATTVHNGFSLHRTYRIFRKLGLRHLTVVDKKNQVVGIITRKDLMEFNLEEMLEPSVCQPKSDTELMFLMSMPHESSHDI
ncbi:CLCC protein, partial [Polypterus senegalus]